MEAREIKYIVGKIYIIGFHPESESQWVEAGPYEDVGEAKPEKYKLGDVDNGLGWYSMAQLQADGSFVLKEMWEPEITLEVRAKGEVHGSR